LSNVVDYVLKARKDDLARLRVNGLEDVWLQEFFVVVSERHFLPIFISIKLVEVLLVIRRILVASPVFVDFEFQEDGSLGRDVSRPAFVAIRVSGNVEEIFTNSLACGGLLKIRLSLHPGLVVCSAHGVEGLAKLVKKNFGHWV
jgi:hypothetical protein